MGHGGKDFYLAQFDRYEAELGKIIHDGLLSYDEGRQILVRRVDSSNSFAADFTMIPSFTSSTSVLSTWSHRASFLTAIVSVLPSVLVDRPR